MNELRLREILISSLLIVGLTYLILWLMTICENHKLFLFLLLGPLFLVFIFPWFFRYLGCRERQERQTFLCRPLDFVRRAWDFQNVWYPLFWFGVFASLADALKDIVKNTDKTGHSIILSLLDEKYIFDISKDLIVVFFITIITSILIKTFGRFEEIRNEQDTLLSEAKENFQEQLKKMTSEAAQAFDNNLQRVASILSFEGVLATLRSLFYARRNDNISTIARDAITSLMEELRRRGEALIEPVVPRMNNATGSNSFDERIRQLEDQIQSGNLSDIDDIRRLITMTTTIERYLANENNVSRNSSGILFFVTSFSFYALTVQRIVQNLSPWYDQLEFYTLMPQTPLQMFYFANSLTSRQWLDFLRYYNNFQRNKFQRNKKGIWRRYFIYGNGSVEGILTRAQFNNHLRHGYYAVEINSTWVPRVFEDEQQYFNLIRTLNQNTINDTLINFGININEWNRAGRSLIVYSNHNISNNNFISITNGFAHFQVNSNSYEFVDISRSQYLNNFFNQRIEFYTDESSNPISFTFPRDFFVICNRGNNGGRNENSRQNDHQWEYLIGLCENVSTTNIRFNLNIAVVLDFNRLQSIGRNSETLRRIYDALNMLFCNQEIRDNCMKNLFLTNNFNTILRGK